MPLIRSQDTQISAIWGIFGEFRVVLGNKHVQIDAQMKNVRLICDTRSVKKGGVSPVKVAIPHKGRTILLPTGVDVLPCQFKEGKIVNTSNRNQLNAILRQRANSVDNALITIEQSTPLHHLSPTELRKRIDAILSPEEKQVTHICDILRVLEEKHEPTTRKTFASSCKQLEQYCKEKKIDYNRLTFDDVTRKWLADYDAWLVERVARNSASLYLGHFRRAFNFAISEEITTNYPFRGYHLRTERTRSRALTVEQLRTLLDAEVIGVERKYRLLFELSLLLLGMNISDMWKAEAPKHGRVNYRRNKTGNRYSVKVGKRAKEILEEIGHPEHLTIASLTTLHTLRQCINDNLAKICERIDDFPKVTSYYARHTWATLAAQIGVPRHIIGAALGHSWTDVTGIYIGISEAQVDEASEKVEKYIYGE